MFIYPIFILFLSYFKRLMVKRVCLMSAIQNLIVSPVFVSFLCNNRTMFSIITRETFQNCIYVFISVFQLEKQTNSVQLNITSSSCRHHFKVLLISPEVFQLTFWHHPVRTHNCYTNSSQIRFSLLLDYEGVVTSLTEQSSYFPPGLWWNLS